ncbi:glycosyltransferase family 2 protein [Spirosoma sp. 48-14]|uniref:glycosyltransferase family 2 protein n=1 Tax=Spirosoma sp. 48-14 TaxID=1895854 RepID=UPI00096561CC|nr:glycosyltransferase family 2 protein [Spirosoma sp. 48-14]OJW75069.1 MAG: hypothetical protein BGO59_19040 [Spirosoma sp. 48-14]
MKISIITINLNNGDGLQKTIESVVNQNYKDFEYIIIDGGSKDDSIDIINKYRNNITSWVSEKDNGIYHAMNKGWKKALGEYCIFLNSGDTLLNQEILKSVVPYLSEDQTIIFGDLILRYKDRDIEAIHPSRISIFDFMIHASYPHQATFINTKLLHELNGYDENFRIISDWLFFLRATIEKKISPLKIPHVVSVYDMNGISSINSKQREEEIVKALEHYFPYLIADKMKSKELQYFKLSRPHQFLKRILLVLKRFKTIN